MTAMTDDLGRNIHYMRISVTELCNLRCRYCMPEDGIDKKEHKEMLTEEELELAVRAAASLGIDKVRITGGEPLVKKNIVSICQRVARVEGIKEVCLTTNGILLPKLAKPLREAGVTRLNLSLDTLDAEKYHYMTRWGNLSDFWKGLDAALDAGFEKIKINAVLIGGFNDDEIVPMAQLTQKYPVDVRFIELMPMYDSGDFGPDAFLSQQAVLDALPELTPIEGDGGVAKLYRLPDAQGNIGIISSITRHFCSSCSRIRLTADGKLKPCLHKEAEQSIKGATYEEMVEVMSRSIKTKPEWHGQLDADHRSEAGRNMNQIGG